MDHELVYLTVDSPPASPKTPTATVVRTSSVGPSSGPPVMQNQNQPWPSPEQQPQPLPKRLRASSEPTMDTRNHNQSPPAQLRLVRSSSENSITRSEKQLIFKNHRLQGTMSKDQLTEAKHELLMRQKESSNPKNPVNCMSRADDTGVWLMGELLHPTMIGPGSHISRVGSSSSSKKPLNVVSQVVPGASLLNMLLESPAHKQNSQVPTSLATPPSISSPPVSVPTLQALLAYASVHQSASFASSPAVSTHPTSASHADISYVTASLVSAPPVPDLNMSPQSVPTSLALAPPLLLPVAIAPPVPTPIVSTLPMPSHIASAPPFSAPLAMTLPVRAGLLSTPCVPAPLTSFPPILAHLESAPAVLAPLLLTASERHIPHTLMLFPVEIPFLLPMKSERGSSSRAGDREGGTNVDLSVYRDDPVIRSGDMDWIVAMPAANPIVEYEHEVAVVPYNGGHRGNVVQDVNLDLSL